MNASEDRLPLRKRQAGLSVDYADFTNYAAVKIQGATFTELLFQICEICEICGFESAVNSLALQALRGSACNAVARDSR